MPERRNRRSETGKPAGSIIAASMPKHAQVRIIAPALAAISGSYSARAIGAADMSDALVAIAALCHPDGTARGEADGRANPRRPCNSGHERGAAAGGDGDDSPRGSGQVCVVAAMDNSGERCDIALRFAPRAMSRAHIFARAPRG